MKKSQLPRILLRPIATTLLGIGLICLTLTVLPDGVLAAQADISVPPHATAIQSTSDITAYLPIVFGASATPPENWLDAVNYYRAMADLPPVTENTIYSDGDWKHARYMVKNDYIGHRKIDSIPSYGGQMA